MKHISPILVCLAFLISCQISEKSNLNSIRIPGEFEPQEAIWLGYKTLENYGDPNDSVTLEMIRTIHPFVDLKLIIESDTIVGDVLEELYNEGIDTTNIELVFQSPTDVWYRDPGPIFGIKGGSELMVIDFKYTGYANVLPDSIDNWAIAHEAIDRDIANRLGIDTVNSIVAIEGGAFETDGKGTLIQVENITLKRNPHLRKEEIEEDFRKCCGIEKVIWLPAGVADDPLNFKRITGDYFGFGTGGHTDEFVRFANDSTILIASVTEEEKDAHPISQLNHEILSKNYEILSNATNADGKPYTIIKVPHTNPQTQEMIVNERWSDESLAKFNVERGDTLYFAFASSYLNYLLTNEVAIIPQYGDENGKMNEKDLAVRQLFEKLYPNRKIVGLNPLYFNNDGGGMHCRFQTQPKLN